MSSRLIRTSFGWYNHKFPLARVPLSLLTQFLRVPLFWRVFHWSTHSSDWCFPPVRSAASGENRLSRAGVRGLYEEMEKLKQGGAALKDRVVLAGRSGTGKTRLVRT
jgi:hypothetical protein